jgi:hypothetical protein
MLVSRIDFVFWGAFFDIGFPQALSWQNSPISRNARKVFLCQLKDVYNT